MKRNLGILFLILTMFTVMSVFAEETVKTDSIMDLDFSSFKLVEPYCAAVKAPYEGAFVSLHWAPSKDAAVAYRLNDKDELFVYAEGDGWMQVMDTGSGYIGFIPSRNVASAGASEEKVTETAEDAPFIDFDIRMDAIPEGYTYEAEESDGNLYATFSKDDKDAMIVYVSVAYVEEFKGFTLDGEITDEQMKKAEDMLSADFNDADVYVSETQYGTKLICVTENDAQSDRMDMVTVWNGYLINVSLQKNTQLTEEDVALASEIVSNMWIVEE